MIFVDTNYYIRLLIGDDADGARLVSRLLLAAAEGKTGLASDVIVFFEVYWLLKSFYGSKKEILRNQLRRLLDLKVNWENKEWLIAALDKMARLSYDLEDAYHLVWAQEMGAEKLATFDKKLVKEWKSR